MPSRQGQRTNQAHQVGDLPEEATISTCGWVLVEQEQDRRPQSVQVGGRWSKRDKSRTGGHNQYRWVGAGRTGARTGQVATISTGGWVLVEQEQDILEFKSQHSEPSGERLE